MTERGFEVGSNLDGTVDTEYRPVTKTESDRVEAEEYQGPKTTLEKIGESSKFKKAVATVLLTGGIAMGSAAHKANAEGKPVSPSGTLSQSVLEGYTVKPETEDDSTPAANPTPSSPESTPSQADAEYTATIAALESLGYSTEHYAKRHEKIEEYKRQLVEYAGEKINLDAYANFVYAIEVSSKLSDAIADKILTHPENTLLATYTSVDEAFEAYKNGKFKKGSNVREIYRKDKDGKETDEIGLFSVVNPKIKSLSADDISNMIDDLEDISPGFLESMNDNNVWVIFQSQAGDSAKAQKIKYNDVMIYYNNSYRNSDNLKNALLVEQFGVRCEALGGEFSFENMSGLLKSRFAFLCCKSLLATVDKKNYDYVEYLCERFQTEIDYYTTESLGNRSLDQVNSLVANAKSKNLVTPFGAKTWAEIDAANSANVEAKSN